MSTSAASFSSLTSNTTTLDYHALSDLPISESKKSFSPQKKSQLSPADQKSLDNIVSLVRARLYPRGLEIQLEGKKQRTYIIRYSSKLEQSELKSWLSDIKTALWTVRLSHKRAPSSGNLRFRFEHQGLMVTIHRTPLLPVNDALDLTTKQNATFFIKPPGGHFIPLQYIPDSNQPTPKAANLN